MDIRSLKYFLEICKHGSFSKAAKNLYISQQGLSKLGEEIVDEADRITDMQELAYQRWERWKKKHGVIENRDDDD